MKTKLSQNKLFKRSLTFVVLLLIIVPLLYLTYGAGVAGRISGTVLFLILGTYGIFEVLNNVFKTKWTTLIFTIISLLYYFLPFEKLNNMINSGISDLKALEPIIKIHIYEFAVISLFLILVLVVFLTEKQKNQDTFKKYLIVFLTISFIPIFVKSFLVLNVYSFWLALTIGAVAAISDTSGFIGGMLLGHRFFKNKMAPKVSPKKTWEGAIFSFTITALFTFLTFYFTGFWANIEINWLFILICSILLPVVSILGDLLFSAIKRTLKIKDFSNILQEHGGIMDRFDSTFLVVLTLTGLISIFI
ncbi:phosphatidate cytidylyltransferase [Mycoplasma procyoni]|uniref:phosphatidate cytidylyltransferase n=1 Tax=Mycoplasma procyoni TaxID=568784 RepID=UPI00197C2487|nr:phosphatidate cytidylyltransferase [Mycoplasma procyoni]MBN3535072.1 phosphatidate cytidylyltransferase [Mycoplasma procyoni]